MKTALMLFVGLVFFMYAAYTEAIDTRLELQGKWYTFASVSHAAADTTDSTFIFWPFNSDSTGTAPSGTTNIGHPTFAWLYLKPVVAGSCSLQVWGQKINGGSSIIGFPLSATTVIENPIAIGLDQGIDSLRVWFGTTTLGGGYAIQAAF